MKNSASQKILIFTTSKEKNGTAKLRDTVEEQIPDYFKAVRSYSDFFFILLFKRNKIRAIFTLSNMHFVIALYFTKKLIIDIPVVLGMYHPNQWKIYLSDHVSKTRHRVFKRLGAVLTHDSIIHSSKEGVDSTEFYCDIKTGTPTILQGPAEILPFVKKVRNGKGIKIVTIGRLVDFKVCTIIAMINAIEKIVANEGLDITYDIYGNGPSQEILGRRITISPIKDKIKLHSFVPKEEYLQTVIQYDLFFGMAGALILAASAGVPSLIAIQEEEREISYGFISDYDQEINPIFGDKSKFGFEKTLSGLLLYYNKLNDNEKTALSEKCSLSTGSYSTESTRERLIKKIDSAPKINDFNISALDFLKIFFEIKVSKIMGKTDEHT
ncbi:MAG: hypothetical protein ABI666_02200 [Ferruginibacter sp.]